MQNDILIPKISVQPLPSSNTMPSNQLCLSDASGTPLCLYTHEVVSLILAVAILLKALATLIRAIRDDVG
jgi:hypothetical protein